MAVTGLRRSVSFWVLLTIAAFSLQGCQKCDQEKVKVCINEAQSTMDPAKACLGWQAMFDCLGTCCDEKAVDVATDCSDCGDKTVKDYVTDTVEIMKNACPEIRDPCF
eukprot:gnl/TRDRNA2_/TRDRNA2_94375_c0_seq1.p1 gnl/TRDRNA2_/TRDRNA2_94375_c0~~gnl/TRDRNA2_/TRDRNA2_94375_c0_seq1.p1  ORF type:complete len:108 (-),score=11.98 gnl/TRDRNA2_/TRDRNA2_94375_c0_seq1:955-1278(-)